MSEGLQERLNAQTEQQDVQAEATACVDHKRMSRPP